MMQEAGMARQGEPIRPEEAEDNLDQPTSSLTIVRIKRRRDDPAEPEIILEAAGAFRNKQPRYEDVLMRFQGLAVMGAPAAAAAVAPRRRFRRLQTLDAAVLEAMSEGELMQLLRFQSGASACTTAAPAAPACASHNRGFAGNGPESLPMMTASTEGPLQPQLLPLAEPPDQGPVQGTGGGDHRADGGGQPRRAVKAATGPSPESRIAALRTSHQQAATAARYKQIRRKRGSTRGDGTESTCLQMYDLERLPAEVERPGPSAAGELGACGRRQVGVGSHRPPPPPAPGIEQSCGELPQPRGRRPGTLPPQKQQQQRMRQQASGVSTEAVQHGPERTEGADPGEALTSANDALLHRYAPLVDEVLRSLRGDQQQQQPGVRSIQARPKRAGHASTAAPAAAASVRLATEEAASAVEGLAPQQQQQPDARLHGATVTKVQQVAVTNPNRGAGAAYGTAASAATIPPCPHGERENGDGEHVFVYDVYIPVHVDETSGADGGEREEDPWPWLDAAADPAVPVIEVADNDDELLWGGQLEAEGGQRAAGDADEHDSEDSNAESYYANTYPDEEDAPYDAYGNDAGSDDGGDEDEVEEVDPPDADAGGGYGWGAALAMRRRGSCSDDDDEEGDGDDDEDEEIFGRRRRRPRPLKKGSSYYRTEDDDYSEHSSFLSEEEERREAEERRRRSIFMH